MGRLNVDSDYRQALTDAILGNANHKKIIDAIDYEHITYNPSGVYVDKKAPGFTDTTTKITDEELVRAYLLLKLITTYGYQASHRVLQVERVYKPVGRPTGKGGRIDILVQRPRSAGGTGFLFIECKTQDTFDDDLKHIDGQLFQLSLQEQPRPKYLLYYAAELRNDQLRDRRILIDTDQFPNFTSWHSVGQPITDAIPPRYNRPEPKHYGNVDKESSQLKPLDRTATPAVFSRLREELHDVIWGGGGTNSNEVFAYIVKLILCKIYDETDTPPNSRFDFQRLRDDDDEDLPEDPTILTARLNHLYRDAERAYLAMPHAATGLAFDPARLAPEKLAYVVGRLEGLSITNNEHHDDLLGEFFEQIVSQDFTQSRGQFFTPMNLVRFMLALSDAGSQAEEVMTSKRDSQGRPRLPYIIDPSCGSGSFLIEYMKLVTSRLKMKEVAEKLPSRLRASHDIWFGIQKNAWAKEHIFGIESNHDLGLAAKVNMVLHGDGSMNTWISNGLLPFDEYLRKGQSNVLGVAQEAHGSLYEASTNEQFDLVISNPPFSLTMSPDEKRLVQTAFSALANSGSEQVFVERWYQLLSEGGKFCCVLPETILDTGSNIHARLFLYQFFRIHAVVSLPYSAFRPFTSTKTCIVLAEKRSKEEALRFKKAWADISDKIKTSNHSTDRREIFSRVIDYLEWSEDPIFMAEPRSVGYKRRKGLPDLQDRNDLYSESPGGDVAPAALPRTVLSSFHSSSRLTPSADLGFWTNLRQIGLRDHLRLDPKYRWLWDHQQGVAFGCPASSRALSEILEVIKLPRVEKGRIASDTTLIDLEHVESRAGLVRHDLPHVDTIGSQKIRFGDCDLAISKLEPYLGKVLMDPPTDALGSTEWVGLRCKAGLPLEFVAHLLMLPDLCEAYRRLQSGKRQARFDPDEFLDLRVQVPDETTIAKIQERVTKKRTRIIQLRELGMAERASIDAMYSG